MEEIIQEKNSPKSNKKRYIILAVIFVLLIAIVGVFMAIRNEAKENFSYCETVLFVYLFSCDDQCASYIDGLNSHLEIANNILRNAEKYKFFLSSEDSYKLKKYREFYDSYPKEAVEKKLQECESLRAQLKENITNLEEVADAVSNKDINTTSKTFTIYRNGIDNSKEKLSKILNCDVSLIKEREFEILKLAEDWLENITPIPDTWEKYDTWEEYSEEFGKWCDAILDFDQVEIQRFYSREFGDGDTLEEIAKSLENNEVLLCSFGDLGNLPSAVIYEECKELLEETNIDFVR